MKAGSRKPWAILLTLVIGILAAGCADLEKNLTENKELEENQEPTKNKELVIGDIGWDESVAVSNLTKALLEDELGYDSVELKTLGVASLFERVGSGELDAFQDVWIPNHQEHLSRVQNNVELLDPWYRDTTRVGIAVPSYMNISSIPQLNLTAVEEIGGIKPEAAISKRISEVVIPTYHLKQEYSAWDAPAAMLFEVNKRIRNGEAFAFVAWSPHWMNEEYDLVYLDDPEEALGELDEPSRITTVVRGGFANDEPVAYAFMRALSLTEEQVNDLEGAINSAGDPLLGVRTWAENNRDVVQPWIDAAKQAPQEP
jgi:glycine betaine/proline transport system substrate-binding protein